MNLTPKKEGLLEEMYPTNKEKETLRKALERGTCPWPQLTDGKPQARRISKEAQDDREN